MDTTRGNIAPPPKLLWRETLTRFRSYKGLQRKGKVEPFNSKRYSLSTATHTMGEPIKLLRNSTPPRLLSSLEPCHQEDTLLDLTVPSDTTNVLYEKDKELMVLPFPTDVMTQCIPESSATQDKHQQENKKEQRQYHHKQQQQLQQLQHKYYYQLRNESLVNKSFRKIIDLSRVTTWMIPKAIATAASSVSLPDHHPLPSHKSLPLKSYSNTSDLTPLRLPSFDEFSKVSEMDQLSSFREEINATGTENTLFNKTRTSSRKNLRFNVHQITNLTSARDLEYELLVRVNHQTVAVRYGQMKKLAKGISSCPLPEDWLSLKVHGPFELAIIINTKPTRPYKMADYLARRGLWPLWSRKKHQLKKQQHHQPQQQQQQQHSDTASSGHSSYWSTSSLSSEGTPSSAVLPSLISGTTAKTVSASTPSSLAAAVTSTTSPSSGMVLSGYFHLSSGNDMELIEDGQHRYRFTKPQSSKSNNNNSSLNIEILVEFLWQAKRPTDSEVTIQESSSSSKQGPSSLAYPWLRYPDGAVPPISPDIENEENLLADKDAVHAAIAHTTHGDHLTFYLHNSFSPKWERYWVMVKNKRLLILSTVYKNKAPIYDIPLELLAQVSKPTEEDQEYVCLNRQVGIVLQLKVDSSSNSNDCINTPLGNRIYILADTPLLALHWARGLTALKLNNKVQDPQ